MNTTPINLEAFLASLKDDARAAVAATDHVGTVHANGAPNNSCESTVDGMMAFAAEFVPAYKALNGTLLPR